MSKKESTDSNADVDMNFIVSGIKFPSDMNESYRIITKLTEKVIVVFMYDLNIIFVDNLLLFRVLN